MIEIIRLGIVNQVQGNQCIIYFKQGGRKKL